MNTPPSPALTAAIARIARDLEGFPLPALPSEELHALEAASAGDAAQLQRWLKRRFAGEPLAYILGEFTFRGRRFRSDARAYITDPETSLLIDAVLERGDRLTRPDRAPCVAEIGCGGGSLAISVQLERPAWRVVGLDLDGAALALARTNAAAHELFDLPLIESDLFAAWPEPAAPDLIFGDPPWGSEETLYDASRDAAHYRAMPAASAFPPGDRTMLHRQILRDVSRRGWKSHLILNGGVLPADELAALARDAAWHELEPRAGTVLLHCRMH